MERLMTERELCVIEDGVTRRWGNPAEYTSLEIAKWAMNALITVLRDNRALRRAIVDQRGVLPKAA